MAQHEFAGTTFDDPFALNSTEQSLLLAALNSNKSDLSAVYTSSSLNSPKAVPIKSDNKSTKAAQTTIGQDMYTSPIQQTQGPSAVNDAGFDESPYIDYDLDETNLDWDSRGDLFDALPGETQEQTQARQAAEEDEEEIGDKRKNHDDDEEEEGGGKRRESDGKTSKKPGRKPLTSEPTTKRKAQNRAAQRAFRERKERHLKELETKVDELEKASESTNHENGLLRAQVERLQAELREYRKRLSFSNNSINRTSPPATSFNLSSRNNWDINNNFQFAFPRFGFGGVADVGPISPLNKRDGSNSASVEKPLMGSATRTSTATSIEELNGLFSPSILANVSSPDYLSYPATTSPNGHSPVTTNPATQKDKDRALSESNTESPASSGYQNGCSSYVTTPESSGEPSEQRKSSEVASNHAADQSQRRKSSSQEAFCKDFQTACGNITNPVPPMISDSDKPTASVASTSNQPKTPGLDTPDVDTHGIDWFANQNGGDFDPQLFGDYRDPQESVMNSDFGFFNDAFAAVPDFNSPQAQLQEPVTAKKPNDLIKDIEDRQDSKEAEVVPGEGPKQFLTCNMLWDRVQRSQRVQSGEADMDDLCAQLKAKAKCSGNGAVIDQKDVDAILGPAPDDTKDFFKMFR